MAGDFSDEEWDIPDEELRILEQRAISSTQQQAINRNVDNTAIGHGRTKTAGTVNGLVKNAAINRTSVQKPVRSADSSFDRLSLDEDGVPLVVEEPPRPVQSRPIRDETTARESWRVARFAQNNPSGHQPQTKQVQSRQQQTALRNDIKQSTAVHDVDMEDVSKRASAAQSSMEMMLAELRRERELLEQTLDKTNQELATARGEIAIIRSKNTGQVKSAERQIGVLKKQLQEESTKHEASQLAKDHAYTKLISDTNFMKHELDEQARTIQSLQRKLKDQPSRTKSNDINATPKKTNKHSLNDGFDNDEIMLMSPSRSPAKARKSSKPATPTNRKRKQQAMAGFPVHPLPLRLSDEPTVPQEPPVEVKPASIRKETTVSTWRDLTTHRHLRFVQKVLSFTPDASGQQTIIEALNGFQFSSNKNLPLGRRLLDRTSNLTGPRLPADLLQAVIDMIAQIVVEKHYAPFSLLLKLVDHILDLDLNIVDAEIIRNLLPPLQTLLQVNPRIRWTAQDPNVSWTDDSPREPLNEMLDTTACLRTLGTIAALISDEPDLITLFWRLIDTDLIFMILAPSQHPDDIVLVLELLHTSIAKDTFANICEAAQQAQMEVYVVEKICLLLWEMPKPFVPPPKRSPFPRLNPLPDPTPAPIPVETLYKTRLAAMDLLARLAIGSLPHPHSNNKELVSQHHGTTLLVNHPNALARLVRCLHDELENLYQPLRTHEAHAQLVNRATAILHHLLTSPQAANLDLAHKLSAAATGVHKFRVGFTRVALKGDSVLDRDIDDRAAEMATEILEEYVTPDEAYALLEAFGRHHLDDHENEEADAQRHADMEV